MSFKYAQKIVDTLLLAKNDIQACDNFNIVYVLKYCNEILNGAYRFDEIEEFFYQRLSVYKDYYFPRIGGFSFYKNKSNMAYYGAYLSSGKREPDIHGTVLFLWGISLIAQVLKINDKLNFKEFIT